MVAGRTTAGGMSIPPPRTQGPRAHDSNKHPALKAAAEAWARREPMKRVRRPLRLRTKSSEWPGLLEPLPLLGARADMARGRWYKPIVFGLTVVLLGLAAAAAMVSWSLMARYGWPGIDLDVMLELGRRWGETGTMYLPYQLAGPYSVAVTTSDLSQTPALYPPAAGLVFAALTFVPHPLLLVAWWVVPLAILLSALRSWRPVPWAWPLMAACVAWPMSSMILVTGGTTMWAAAFVALGLRRGWLSALVLLKPTLLPFALVGIRDWRWWGVTAVIVALTLAGPWREYLEVARNAQGVDYAFGSYPLMLVPVVAWLAREPNMVNRR